MYGGCVMKLKMMSIRKVELMRRHSHSKERMVRESRRSRTIPECLKVKLRHLSKPKNDYILEYSSLTRTWRRGSTTTAYQLLINSLLIQLCSPKVKATGIVLPELVMSGERELPQPSCTSMESTQVLALLRERIIQYKDLEEKSYKPCWEYCSDT